MISFLFWFCNDKVSQQKERYSPVAAEACASLYLHYTVIIHCMFANFSHLVHLAILSGLLFAQTIARLSLHDRHVNISNEMILNYVTNVSE